MSKAREIINTIEEIRGMKKTDYIMVWLNNELSTPEYTIAISAPMGGWSFWKVKEGGEFVYRDSATAFNPRPEWGKRVAVGSLPSAIRKTIKTIYKEQHQ